MTTLPRLRIDALLCPVPTGALVGIDARREVRIRRLVHKERDRHACRDSVPEWVKLRQHSCVWRVCVDERDEGRGIIRIAKDDELARSGGGGG